MCGVRLRLLPSQTRRHLWAAYRHNLLALRAYLDVMVERLDARQQRLATVGQAEATSRSRSRRRRARRALNGG